MISIRKESFGYVIFDKGTRSHAFVHTAETVDSMSDSKLRHWIGNHLVVEDGRAQIEIIQPPLVHLPLSAPLAVYLEISARCNFSCEHCYKPNEPRMDTLSVEEFKSVISEMADLGVFEVRLCGNEPTASPHFFEICHHIKDVGLYLSINTNGFRGGRFRHELIELNPNCVVVSLDGDEKTHDLLRREGSYRRAIETLEALAAAGIHSRINMCVSRTTMQYVESIGAIATKYKAGVSFFPLRTMGRPTDYKRNADLDKESMFQIVHTIQSLRSRYPDTPFETFFDILGNQDVRHHTMDFNVPCPPRKNGFITYNGDFFPCDFIRYLGNRWFCGNVRQGGLRKIWSDSETLHEFWQLRRSKCEQCRFYLTKCYGGCWCSYEVCRADCNPLEDLLCFAPMLADPGSSVVIS